MSEDKKLGRPTNYKTEYDEMLVEFARNGMPDSYCVTVEHMADYFNTHKAVLYEWVIKHQTFADAFSRAREITRIRMVNYACENMIMRGGDKFNEKTFDLIMRNKFGYKDKTFLRLASMIKSGTMAERATNVLNGVATGVISIEDAKGLMDIFAGAINIENESELRPLVEELKSKMESKK